MNGQHFMTWNVGACKKCSYIFSSDADKERHILVVHQEKRLYEREAAEVQAVKPPPPAENPDDAAPGPDVPAAPARAVRSNRYNFPGCGLRFESQHRLRKHKKQQGHATAKGRPRKD